MNLPICRFGKWYYHFVILFHAIGLLLKHLERTENLWFSDVFTGYRKTTVA